MNYELYEYEEVTRKILDSVKIGDLIKINYWKRPMRVRCVSENYILLTQNLFDSVYYSVVSKLTFEGIRYNSLLGGMFFCGPDHWVLGGNFNYKFDNDKDNRGYLQTFESGLSKISQRRGVAIRRIQIKRSRK